MIPEGMIDVKEHDYKTGWERYKPKYHKNGCYSDNCEKDCEMECDICRATPWDTKYYQILDGVNHSLQLCEECFEKYVKNYKENFEVKER